MGAVTHKESKQPKGRQKKPHKLQWLQPLNLMHFIELDPIQQQKEQSSTN